MFDIVGALRADGVGPDQLWHEVASLFGDKTALACRLKFNREGGERRLRGKLAVNVVRALQTMRTDEGACYAEMLNGGTTIPHPAPTPQPQPQAVATATAPPPPPAPAAAEPPLAPAAVPATNKGKQKADDQDADAFSSPLSKTQSIASITLDSSDDQERKRAVRGVGPQNEPDEDFVDDDDGSDDDEEFDQNENEVFGDDDDDQADRNTWAGETGTIPRMWNKQEREAFATLCTQLVARYGQVKWSKVQDKYPDRSLKSMRNRWTLHKQRLRDHEAKNDSASRVVHEPARLESAPQPYAPWSKAKLQQLYDMYDKQKREYGTCRWDEICAAFADRSLASLSSQIQERRKRLMGSGASKSRDLNGGELDSIDEPAFRSGHTGGVAWTKAECDVLLARYDHNMHKYKRAMWKKIMRYLPGRSEGAASMKLQALLAARAGTRGGRAVSSPDSPSADLGSASDHDDEDGPSVERPQSQLTGGIWSAAEDEVLDRLTAETGEHSDWAAVAKRMFDLHKYSRSGRQCEKRWKDRHWTKEERERELFGKEEWNVHNLQLLHQLVNAYTEPLKPEDWTEVAHEFTWTTRGDVRTRFLTSGGDPIQAGPSLSAGAIRKHSAPQCDSPQPGSPLNSPSPPPPLATAAGPTPERVRFASRGKLWTYAEERRLAKAVRWEKRKFGGKVDWRRLAEFLNDKDRAPAAYQSRWLRIEAGTVLPKPVPVPMPEAVHEEAEEFGASVKPVAVVEDGAVAPDPVASTAVNEDRVGAAPTSTTTPAEPSTVGAEATPLPALTSVATAIALPPPASTPAPPPASTGSSATTVPSNAAPSNATPSNASPAPDVKPSLSQLAKSISRGRPSAGSAGPGSSGASPGAVFGGVKRGIEEIRARTKARQAQSAGVRG